MSEFGLWYWLIVVVILLLLFRPLLGGFISGLRGKTASETPGANAPSCDTPVVGESHYPANLLSICGARAPHGVEKFYKAQLILEAANPYDPKAVHVDIASLTVGYSSREAARAWRARRSTTSPLNCNSVIRGGWDRDPNDQGSFGVWLNLPK